jgi:hypothetical protein
MLSSIDGSLDSRRDARSLRSVDGGGDGLFDGVGERRDFLEPFLDGVLYEF